MLQEKLGHLEDRIAEAESLLRILRQENEQLRLALAAQPRKDAAETHAAPGARPVRLLVLEAERQEVRSRLRRLIEAL